MDYQFDTETELIFSQLTKHIGRGSKVYLVGGIVRDILLNKPVHDIDISYCGNVREYSKKVADELGASFFMLNEQFQTARIIYKTKDNKKRWIDIVATRNNDIESDLRGRDFTINAMAINLIDKDTLIDPLFGAMDLKNKVLHITNINSISDDPIRILRAIRLSVQFSWKLSKETINAIKHSCELLVDVTNERKRDEIFKILDLPNPAIALRILKNLNLLVLCFPGIINFHEDEEKTGIDSFEEVFSCIQTFSKIEDLIFYRKKIEAAADLHQAEIRLGLSGFRIQLENYFQQTIHQDRKLRSLFVLCVLYTNSLLYKASDNKVSSFEDFQLNEQIHEIKGTFKNLVITKLENDWINNFFSNIYTVRHAVIQRSVIFPSFAYEFFNNSKNSGIAICIFLLVYQLNVKGSFHTDPIWGNTLNVSIYLLNAYFNHYNEWINPPIYLNGHDVKKILRIRDGKKIGEILQIIAQKTVCGEISDRQDAINFLKNDRKGNN